MIISTLVVTTNDGEPVYIGLSLVLFGVFSLFLGTNRERRLAWARKKWVRLWVRTVSIGLIVFGLLVVIIGVILQRFPA